MLGLLEKLLGTDNYPAGTTNAQAQAAAREVREYNPAEWDAGERAETEVRSWFGGGGLSILLLCLPVFLFDIAWYVAWTFLPLPDRSIEFKMQLYGGLIIGWQLLWTLLTLGYGLVAIPASVLSFVVLVWVL